MFTAIVYTTPKTVKARSAVIAFQHGFVSRMEAIACYRARADKLGIRRDIGSIATEAFAGFFQRTGYQLLPEPEHRAISTPFPSMPARF